MVDLRSPCTLADLIRHQASMQREYETAHEALRKRLAREGEKVPPPGKGDVWAALAECKREYDVLTGKAELLDKLMTSKTGGRELWESIIQRYAELEALRTKPIEREAVEA